MHKGKECGGKQRESAKGKDETRLQKKWENFNFLGCKGENITTQNIKEKVSRVLLKRKWNSKIEKSKE